jgi:haloalkane dehalogenase
MNDPWLPLSVAQNFADSVQQKVELVQLNNVGHYPQEHYSEEILKDLLPFVRLAAKR